MSVDTVADVYQKIGAPYNLSTDAYSNTYIGVPAPTVETASVVNPSVGDGLPGTLLPGVNILSKTQQFDDAIWTKTRVTVTANAIAAPDSTLTADKIVETAINNTHTINGALVPTTAGLPYIWSLYAKAGERSNVRIRAASNVTFLGDVYADLLSGMLIFATRADLSSPVVGIVNAGNGWYRIWMRITMPVGTTGASLNAWLADSGINTTYLGDITKGLYLWGAQLEQSNTLGGYTAVA